MRAFDQARHVTYREAKKIRILNNADLRMQGGEWVGGDSRPGMGNGGEQGRFACIRIAHDTHFCDGSQFEQELALAAFFAGLGETRGLARSGGKVSISQTSSATFAENEPLAMGREVGDLLAFWR